MTDGMSENAREARGIKREHWGERDAISVPVNETPREKIQRLCVEHRLAQVRSELVQKMASIHVEHANAIAKLKLRCTTLENANGVLQASLNILAPDAARNQAIDKIPRMEPALREPAAADPALLNLRPSTTSDIRTSPPAAATAPAAAAPPVPEDEELDPAEEEAIHAAELRARESAAALRVRDNLVPSPPPIEEEDEDTGDYDFEPATAPAVPGYDESNPADRKMRDLVLQGKLRVEQRAHREVVVPGPEGSRSDVFENKETFKLLTRRFYFDSANKLWGRDVVG
jgi:hypothetical protein